GQPGPALLRSVRAAAVSRGNGAGVRGATRRRPHVAYGEGGRRDCRAAGAGGRGHADAFGRGTQPVGRGGAPARRAFDRRRGNDGWWSYRPALGTPGGWDRTGLDLRGQDLGRWDAAPGSDPRRTIPGGRLEHRRTQRAHLS